MNRTTEAWLRDFSEELPEMCRTMVVYDPDGWDRTNFQYSWFEEEISLEELTSRFRMSTLIPKAWA